MSENGIHNKENKKMLIKNEGAIISLYPRTALAQKFLNTVFFHSMSKNVVNFQDTRLKMIVKTCVKIKILLNDTLIFQRKAHRQRCYEDGEFFER